MNNFKTIISGVDVSKIIHEIENTDLWQDKSLRTCEMMQQKEIILQYNSFDEMLAGADLRETFAYPAFYKLPTARMFVFELMKFVQGERLGRVFITSLGSGKRIAPHKDTDAGFPAGYFNRYHLSLKDNENTVFKCGNEIFRPEVGDVFTFDNLQTHLVENAGDTERWTMVVDIKKPLTYTPSGTFDEMMHAANAHVVTNKDKE